jgi:acid phosphatase family membrane protein YuiD
MKAGVSDPAFGVALTLAFIVILDAASLRGQVGRHAAAINLLNSGNAAQVVLRERMGYTRIKIAAGIIVGIAMAAAVSHTFLLETVLLIDPPSP